MPLHDDDVLRAAVAGVGVAVLAACTGGSRPSGNGLRGDRFRKVTGTPFARAADANPLRRWHEAETGLVALYEATTRAVPTAARMLAPLREHHVAHLAAIGEKLAALGASPSASASASSPSPTPTVPADATAALKALAAAETAAAALVVSELSMLGDPKVVVLAAEISASNAQHAALLLALPGRAS